MKKTLIIVSILIITLGENLSADSKRKGSDISLQSSYILPLDDTDFNSSLSLGLGAKFWGVFEFSGHGYLEVAKNAPTFAESFKAPKLFSVGIGMNIPMGGFRLKGDYQRFFAFKNSDTTDTLSISNFNDSYKLGVGISLSDFLELEVYSRTFLKDQNFTGHKKSFIGAGLIFIL